MRLILSLALSGLLAAAALARPLSAHDYSAGAITVDHPVALETPRTARSGGGYMTIVNGGDTDDTLLEVRAAFPKVMIHETVVGDDGVARMVHRMSVPIPAGETVTLEPGGLHVMFMGLGGDPLEPGETIPATLIFEKAGEMAVEFSVEKRNQSGNHSNH